MHRMIIKYMRVKLFISGPNFHLQVVGSSVAGCILDCGRGICSCCLAAKTAGRLHISITSLRAYIAVCL